MQVSASTGPRRLFVGAGRYGVPMPSESAHAPRPGWHGIPPSADRFRPPVQLDAPTGTVTEPAKALPIWLELAYPDGGNQTMRGFAMAWTSGEVYAQWVEFSRAREAWVTPGQCTRREIPVKDRFGAAS